MECSFFYQLNFSLKFRFSDLVEDGVFVFGNSSEATNSDAIAIPLPPDVANCAFELKVPDMDLISLHPPYIIRNLSKTPLKIESDSLGKCKMRILMHYDVIRTRNDEMIGKIFYRHVHSPMFSSALPNVFVVAKKLGSGATSAAYLAIGLLANRRVIFKKIAIKHAEMDYDAVKF